MTTNADLPDLALPALVLFHAAHHPEATAIRQKRGQAWESLTWAQYAHRVRHLAAGLLHVGITPPCNAGILGENSVDWVVAQMAISLIGGCAFGCYPTSSTPDLHHALGLARARVLFCENTGFLAKVESIRDQLPDLQRIVLFEAQDLAPDRADIITLADLEQAGRDALLAQPELLDAFIANLSLDQPGLIVFTSGSTGAPKAAVLSYRNMRSAALGFGRLLGFGPEAMVLSYLPLCHIAEQVMTNVAPLYLRAAVAFGGGLPTLVDDLRSIRPTFFSGVPRVWLRLQAQITAHFQQENRAQALADALAAGGGVAFKPPAMWTKAEREAVAAHAGIMAQARAHVGLDRLGVATSGAASLPVEVLGFFRALGVDLLELYGQTETCSIMTIHHPDRVVPGTVGEPIATVELRLARDGEVLIRGEGVFLGYYGNPEATAQTVIDGWLHTGDIGRIEDGQLRIIDRKKDIMITDGGKNITPAEIEALMRTSPLIAECVLVAEGRKFVSALIQIDPAAFAVPPAPTYAAVVADPATQAAIRAEILRLNEALPRVAQVRRALILPAPLQHDQGELTATLKLRRFVVHQRYAEVIEGIYTGSSGFDIARG